MNIILAKNMAELPILANPNAAATIAITKNATAQRNIVTPLSARRQILFTDIFNVFSRILYIRSRPSRCVTA